MGLPPPAVAYDVSRSLRELAVDVAQTTDTLVGAVACLQLRWQGHAAGAAERLLSGLIDGAVEAGDALGRAATTWDHLGHDLTSVHRRIQAVDLATDAANGVMLLSLLQMGLDPVSDAAAVTARAGAAAGLAAVKAMLRAAIERAISRVTVDRALLAATKIVGVYAAKGIATGTAKAALTAQFEYGSVPWARLAGPSQLAADLVPTKVSALLVAAHTDVALRAPVPACFRDRASFDQARTVAADWSARSTGGTQVTVGEGPDGGARVTVHGASRPLTPGRAYSAAEVESLDVDLARALDQIGVYADAPVTVVVER